VTDSRQQRRARERAAIAARVGGKVAAAQTVFDLWRTFRQEVLREVTSPVQLEETRRGFYAGAAAILELVVRVSADDVTEDRGVEILQALHEELQAFATDLRSTEEP
jgi:hypothetical protein